MAFHATNDGHDIHYEVRGDAGPALVFLNGMTQSTAHWKSISRALSREFRVITYDARGQGQTAVGDTPLSLELHAADLADLVAGLGFESVNLVGFSHGSRVALAFARDFPEKLDKLVLTSATAVPTALARTIIRSWAEVLEKGGLEAMAWCSLPAILGTDYLEDHEHLIPGIIKASVQRNDPAGVAALLQGMRDYPDLAELAEQVQAATLVVSASEDLLVTRAGAEELARLAGGDHVEVEGCGHTIPIEKPTEFREIIVGFLGE